MPATDFQPLLDSLTELTSADDAIIQLLNQFAADVTAHAGDAAKVTEIAAAYKAQAARLAEAVSANTTPVDTGGGTPPADGGVEPGAALRGRR